MKTTLIESPNCFFISSTSPFSNAGGSGSFFAGGVVAVDGLLTDAGASLVVVGEAGVVVGLAGGFATLGGEEGEEGLVEGTGVDFFGSSLLLLLLLMLLYL
jgi:hypothetical protein